MRHNGECLMRLPSAMARRRVEALSSEADLREIAIEPMTIGALSALSFAPKSDKPKATILYLHGGGYVLGSANSYRELLARIARSCKARVIAVDYRLAPEHPFPAALDDCHAAYRTMIDHGFDPGSLFVAGDSSGGALAVATLVAVRDGGGVLPRGAILLSPWVDLESAHPSIALNASFDWGDGHYLRHWSTQYLDGADARDPRASPLHADLAGLPRLLVQVGTAELLHDEVIAFADKARARGVDVDLRASPEMVHGWMLLNGVFAQAQDSVEAIADFVRAT